jgi:hypothetical protein
MLAISSGREKIAVKGGLQWFLKGETKGSGESENQRRYNSEVDGGGDEKAARIDPVRTTLPLERACCCNVYCNVVAEVRRDDVVELEMRERRGEGAKRCFEVEVEVGVRRSKCVVVVVSRIRSETKVPDRRGE